jgi:hypothetical protein
VPYPVDYGGVFDLFYKIKTLHQLGILIHLHCFEYGRGRQDELLHYCEEVKYYARNEGHKGFSYKLPYIVCSRSNAALAENLLMDDYPVLLEGIHCTQILNDGRFKNRKIILRLHNVEFLYYRQLYQSSNSIFKKIYYLYESRILKKYEKNIAAIVQIAAVAQQDQQFYQLEFGAKNITYIPIFLPGSQVNSKLGTGCYCLYHGNLSVAENEQAVIWLLKKVFNDLTLPLLIAGKKPSSKLEKMVRQYQHGCLVADPTELEMQDIISKAQVHVLPSFNCTGVKLKLLNALFNGRHCIVNPESINGTGLENICRVAGSAESFKKMLSATYHQPFSSDDIHNRETILGGLYNNDASARQLIQHLW